MRIGINVPNELVKRIRKVDPETNISHVCREALEVHANMLERIVVEWDDDDMDDVIERLSWSDNIEPDWAGYGWEDAQNWVMAVDREGWESFFRLYSYATSRNGHVANPSSWVMKRLPGIKSFYDRMMENSDWLHWQCYLDGNNSVYHKVQEEYDRAWMGFVIEVRRKQSQHDEEIRDRVMAERRRAWAARPDPELPPQLLR